MKVNYISNSIIKSIGQYFLKIENKNYEPKK